MMRKIVVFLAAMLTIATLSTGAASARANGTYRPFVGSGYQTGWVDYFSTSAWVVQGPMTGNFIGKGTLTSTRDDLGLTSEFITAANGDKLLDSFGFPDIFVAPNDPACDAAARPGELALGISDDGGFGGGTGRFANASGPLHRSGCMFLDFSTPYPEPNFRATLTYLGTISY